jgi:hypothetical protein
MREIRYAYPARLRRGEDGRFVVSFPDLPEALTDGATLAEALMSRIVDGEAIPAPSPRKAAQRLIAPDPTVALKAALHRVVR